MRIIVEDGSDPAIPNSGLVRVVVRAHIVRDRLLADKVLTLDDIAKSEGMVPSYATRLFRLTLLAPDIVSAILSGKHPPELTARKLMDDTRLPLDWNEQRRSLGFASARPKFGKLRRSLGSDLTCLSFLVHPSRQYFGRDVGDCHSTKIRKRSARGPSTPLMSAEILSA